MREHATGQAGGELRGGSSVLGLGKRKMQSQEEGKEQSKGCNGTPMASRGGKQRHPPLLLQVQHDVTDRCKKEKEFNCGKTSKTSMDKTFRQIPKSNGRLWFTFTRTQKLESRTLDTQKGSHKCRRVT